MDAVVHVPVASSYCITIAALHLLYPSDSVLVSLREKLEPHRAGL